MMPRMSLHDRMERYIMCNNRIGHPVISGTPCNSVATLHCCINLLKLQSQWVYYFN